MKSYFSKIFVLTFLLLILPVFVFAASIKVNGRISLVELDKNNNITKAEAQYLKTDGELKTVSITDALRRTIFASPPYVGEKLTMEVSGSTALSISKLGELDPGASQGEESKNAPKSGYYSELFHKYIPAGSMLKTWVNDLVMPWALGIIGTIAVVSLMAAGVMYMTSAGNTKQLDLAKTIMKNALSGVAIIVMAKFFLRILGAS